MKITELSIDRVKPYTNNPRRITEYAIDQLAASIQKYGFQQPIVIDHHGVIIVGHTRFAAAKKLGLASVPTVTAELTEDEAAAYRIADNRTGELTSWSVIKLSDELKALGDFEVPGFHLDETKILTELSTEREQTKSKIIRDREDEGDSTRPDDAFAQLTLFVPRDHIKEIRTKCQDVINAYKKSD